MQSYYSLFLENLLKKNNNNINRMMTSLFLTASSPLKSSHHQLILLPSINSWKPSTSSSSSLSFSPPSISSFHTSSVVKGAYPPFNPPKITRRATLRHLQKMKETHEKLGDRFKFLEKHKRYEGLPGYVAPPPPPAPKFVPFLLTKEILNPKPIVPGSITETMSKLKLNAQDVFGQDQNNYNHPDNMSESTNTTSIDSSNLVMSSLKKNEVDRELKLRPEHIPPVIPSAAQVDPAIVSKDLPLPEIAAAGPYYAFGLTPSEIKFVLEDTPKAMKLIKEKLKLSFGKKSALMVADGKMPTLDEQAEMIRRVLSIENVSSKEIRKVNKSRIMAMLQRNPIDVGSFEVQAGSVALKIKAMKEHLAKNKKDTNSKQILIKWEARLTKILRYLRRSKLDRFVEICKVIGVDPNAIRA